MAKKRCSVVEDGQRCNRAVVAAPYCAKHYLRVRRHGDPLAKRKISTPMPPCTVLTVGGPCGRPAKYRAAKISMHYNRLRRHGDPNVRKKIGNGEALQWLKDKLSYEGDECQLWPHHRGKNGYAFVRYNGRAQHAARVLCEWAKGPPPFPKADAAHSCGNGNLGCCTKRHIRWATKIENSADTVRYGRSNRGERSPSHKLTEQQVRFIRRSLVKPNILATKLHVSSSTICDVRARRTWAHVD